MNRFLNGCRFIFVVSINTIMLMTACIKEKNSVFEPYDPYPANGATMSGTDITLSWKIGNPYKTIQIGTQVWMAENLKTTRYNDGTSIPSVTTARWSDYGPFYGWYNDDIASFKSVYGALYKGYTVSTGKLCPTGWQVPSYNEWETLANYLGGVNVAGGKMKEAGTVHWKTPNTGATNESGFTALPVGFYDYSFKGTGTVGIFWSCYGLPESSYLYFL